MPALSSHIPCPCLPRRARITHYSNLRIVATAPSSARTSFHSTSVPSPLPLASIERTFRTRVATSLLSSRGAVLPTAAETPTSDGADFDLVTWLVILEPEPTT